MNRDALIIFLVLFLFAILYATGIDFGSWRPW